MCLDFIKKKLFKLTRLLLSKCYDMVALILRGVDWILTSLGHQTNKKLA